MEYLLTGISNEYLVRSPCARELSSSPELLCSLKHLEDRADIVLHNEMSTCRLLKSRRDSPVISDSQGRSRTLDSTTKGSHVFNCSAYNHYSTAYPKLQRRPRCDIWKQTGHVLKYFCQSASGGITGRASTENCVTAAEVESRSA